MSKDEPKAKKRPKIYIVGGGYEYIRLMYNLGCDGAKSIDDADVVLFTGGEDVNPELYGEICMPRTYFSRDRDEKEKAIFDVCVERGIPMIGICRGGQLLNILNGGKMWQHVTNHAGNHLARIEVPPFNENGKRRTIEVTSTHHQMMKPTNEAIILATALVSHEKHSVGYTRIGKPVEEDPDIEVVFYDDTHSLCFQPHPEFRNAPAACVDFFEECLENFIFPRIEPTVRAIEDQIPKAIRGKKAKKPVLTVPVTKEK